LLGIANSLPKKQTPNDRNRNCDNHANDNQQHRYGSRNQRVANRRARRLLQILSHADHFTPGSRQTPKKNPPTRTAK
jgi:hypothetical protein